MMTKLEAVGLAAVALLLAIWPVPNTISLRDALLLLGLAVFIPLARRAQRLAPRPFSGLFLPTAWLVALTAWMIVVAIWISNETAWSLDEIRGQWLKGLVAFALGVLVAMTVAGRQSLSTHVLLGIATILFLHVLYVDVNGVRAWLDGATGYRSVGFTGGPDKSSFLTNTLFVFLFAEILMHWRRRQRLMPVPDAVLYVALAATVASVFFERVRYGLVALAAILIATALLSVRLAPHDRRTSASRAIGLAAAVVFAGLLVLVAVGFKPGTSLHAVSDTVALAFDTTTHKAWLNPEKYGYPTLPDGNLVDESAYLRVAWFKEGLNIVSKHPLGIGYGRNAFGHGLVETYGEGRGHSHSGYLDLVIGVGVPGALLWLGFLASLLMIAIRELPGAVSGYALVLLLLVADFGTRMLFDSIIRDHMLQMFMFLAGLLLALIAGREARA